MSAREIGSIVSELIAVKNCVQIYHWQTRNHARHVAAGEYYEKLDKKIDKFVESLQKNGYRMDMTQRIICGNVTDEKAVKMLEKFVNYLNDLEHMFFFLKQRNDILNIRDEMVTDANQTLYLFTLN